VIAHSRPRGEGGREAGVWGLPPSAYLAELLEQPGRIPAAPAGQRVPIGSSALIALSRQSFGGSTLVGKLYPARPARVPHPATGFSFRFLPSAC
jgi:hypothetical protein